MTKEELFKIYEIEREYQFKNFGNYQKNPSLNLSSFITFLDHYLSKIKKEYTESWDEELPQWLVECKEFNLQEAAPVNAYKELIKLFTLAGAALESYTIINPEYWREE